MEQYFKKCWGNITAEQLEFFSQDPVVDMIYDYVFSKARKTENRRGGKPTKYAPFRKWNGGGVVTKNLAIYGQGKGKQISKRHGRGAATKNINKNTPVPEVAATTSAAATSTDTAAPTSSTKKIIILQNIVIKKADEQYVPEVVFCPNKEFYKYF